VAPVGESGSGETPFVTPIDCGSSNIHKELFAINFDPDTARHSPANDDGEFAWAA
jgi:hypothetical protein